MEISDEVGRPVHQHKKKHTISLTYTLGAIWLIECLEILNIYWSSPKT